jgi:hypothetical protein
MYPIDITVVSTGFRPPDGGKRCVESVLRQVGVRCGHIVVDAAGQTPPKEHFENLVEIIHRLPDDRIVACVDLDDWLASDTALAAATRLHRAGALVTYGSFRLADGRPGFARAYTPDEFGWLRKAPWLATHLKTFRAGLFKRIDPADFKLDGKWIVHGRDHALMFPLLEMVGPERAVYCPQVLYVYNTDSNTVMDEAERAKETSVVAHIRSMPPYKPIATSTTRPICGTANCSPKTTSHNPKGPMEHYFKEMSGYFTFPDFYEWVAGQMIGKSAPHLVEVGVCHGQSAAFLGVELANRNVTDARIDLVDRFHDEPSESILRRLKEKNPSVGWVAMPGNSWDVANLYRDDSLDFVFIDADHSYEAVSRDIDAWKPKVKRGGILAGHDYIPWTNPTFGVIKAVNERFERFEVWPGVTWGGDAQMQGNYFPCWSVRL